jgi:hypothetical protein
MHVSLRADLHSRKLRFRHVYSLSLWTRAGC